MNIFTLYVGQGQFVAVTGETEAIIVDTYFPATPGPNIVNVKGALAQIFRGKSFVGLIISGFDSDHFTEKGMRLILNKYRPDWIMYPSYFKDSRTAGNCFAVLEEFEEGQEAFDRISIDLDINTRRKYTQISNEFTFELFSPDGTDLTSSNNNSIVCKVTERSTGASYLITGDTEADRWHSIVEAFGDEISSDVLAAPHHGSRNGITEEALRAIVPDLVLISAGVDNQYDHPHEEALELYWGYAEAVVSTNDNGGQSLLTIVDAEKIETHSI